MKLNTHKTSFLLAVFLVALTGCSRNNLKILTELKHSPEYTVLTVISPAVSSGELDSERRIEIHITLPESYESHPERRYPVVYGLHGFGDSPLGMIAPFQKAMKGTGLTEVIFVAVDGTNSLGGSFFANSTATGNWEDLIVKETVTLIDSRYRTISESAGRMLSGFSMGGFAAWNLALKHPDIFSSAWICCPGAWDEKGLKDTLDGWNSTYRNAYGAVFAPDHSLPAPYARIPVFNGTEEDDVTQSLWNDGFGGVIARIAEHNKKDSPLNAVCFVYGSRDDYRWIPRGTRYAAAKMAESGIPVEIHQFNTGHRITTDMINDSFIPFVKTHVIRDISIK